MAGFTEKFKEQKEKMSAQYEELVKTEFDTVTLPKLDVYQIRKYLIDKIPFYSDALQKVDIVFIENKQDLPSFAFTDGYKVYMSLKLYTLFGKAAQQNKLPWFKNADVGTIFVLLHEIGHIIFKSFERKGDHRNAGLWNVATDEKINEFVTGLMKDANLFPSSSAYQAFMEVLNCHFVLDPSKYADLTAEEVYGDMYRLNIQLSGGGGAMGGDMVGDGKPEKDAEGNELSDQDKMARDILRSEMENYMQKNASKLAGSGTSTNRELAYIQEPPKVSLREILRKITDRVPETDWGYGNRQSRFDHMLPHGCRLPTEVPSFPDKVRKVCFVLDSSGSMSNQQLNDAVNIIREIEGKYTRNPIHLIIHTDQVVYSEPLKTFSDTPGHFSGGTAFKCVSDEILRLEREDRVVMSTVIWLTDGYAEYNDNAYTYRDFPYYKTLKWIIHGSDRQPCIGQVWNVDTIE